MTPFGTRPSLHTEEGPSAHDYAEQRLEIAQSDSGNQVIIPRGMLPSSGRARLRLNVTDGFNTTVTAACPVVVAARAPTVTIIDPAPRDTVQGGESLYMRGYAADDHGHAIGNRGLRWYAGRHLLGTGQMLSAIIPADARGVRLVVFLPTGRAPASGWLISWGPDRFLTSQVR